MDRNGFGSQFKSISTRQMDFEGRLRQTNGRLRSAQVGVSVEAIGSRLYLRAILPARLGGFKREPYQQRLALHYHANVAGLQMVEEARKVRVLVDCISLIGLNVT